MVDEKPTTELDVPDKIDAFTFVRAIMEEGRNLLGERPDLLSDYRSARFLINRALSFYPDTILTAQAVNERPWMPDPMHAIFLINMVRAKNRGRRKWGKRDRDERLPSLMRYYQCSERDASAMIDLHTEEQLTQIDEQFDTGGVRRR